MNGQEKFNKNSLPENENFHSLLDMEHRALGYAQAGRVCKDFEITNLGGYRDLYVQSDILLLIDEFNSF